MTSEGGRREFLSMHSSPCDYGHLRALLAWEIILSLLLMSYGCGLMDYAE